MKPTNTFSPPSSRRPSAIPCIHRKLILLPGRKCRLRCRRCGRIHKAETLDTGYCPRCFRHDGVKRCDFTKTNIIDVSFALYQCEDCGVMIHAG